MMRRGRPRGAYLFKVHSNFSGVELTRYLGQKIFVDHGDVVSFLECKFVVPVGSGS